MGKLQPGDQPDIPERENYEDFYEDEAEFLDDDDSPSSDDDDDFENAMDECGQMGDGFCTMVGSEYCDWECPFSRQMHANANRKRDAAGRFCK